MDLLGGFKRSLKAVVVFVLASLCIFGSGAYLAFVVSPQAALEWRRIDGLPILTAADFSGMPAGDEAALTGTLSGNRTLNSEGLVMYRKDVWRVEEETSSSGTPGTPKGSWETIETNVPVLSLSISGGTVRTTKVDSVKLGGSLHETLQPGKSSLTARYQDQDLPDESVRTQGLSDGDLVTVVGRKATTGDLIPDRLFGGDRVQLVASIRDKAQTSFFVGVLFMICAPLFLGVGLFMTLTGRVRSMLKLGN